MQRRLKLILGTATFLVWPAACGTPTATDGDPAPVVSSAPIPMEALAGYELIADPIATNDADESEAVVPTCFRTPLLNEGATALSVYVASVGYRKFWFYPPMSRIGPPYYSSIKKKWFASYAVGTPADDATEEWRIWNAVLRMRCVGNASIGAIWADSLLDGQFTRINTGSGGGGCDTQFIYDPETCDPNASDGNGSSGDGSGDGGPSCHTEYIYVEIDYGDGTGWHVWWEGYASVCE